jgi:hypothetical protein
MKRHPNPSLFGIQLRSLFAAVLALSLLQRVVLAAEPRPNILFIYLDDFGWRDAGFMGSDFYETPNLDRLATEGMVFTDAYSCAANCAPARAAWQTEAPSTPPHPGHGHPRPRYQDLGSPVAVGRVPDGHHGQVASEQGP